MNDPTDLINQLRVAIASVLKEMELDVSLERIVLDRRGSDDQTVASRLGFCRRWEK